MEVDPKEDLPKRLGFYSCLDSRDHVGMTDFDHSSLQLKDHALP
jgi:hypothetical protein